MVEIDMTFWQFIYWLVFFAIITRFAGIIILVLLIYYSFSKINGIMIDSNWWYPVIY